MNLCSQSLETAIAHNLRNLERTAYKRRLFLAFHYKNDRRVLKMKEKYTKDYNPAKVFKNIEKPTCTVVENGDKVPTIKCIATDYSYKHQIVWKNVVGFVLLHVFALWGLVLIFTGMALWKTSIWGK